MFEQSFKNIDDMTNKSLKPTNKENSIIFFKEKQIRRTWHSQEWWFSVADICGVLTKSAEAGAYWRKLKKRLKEEESEVVTNCHELKLEAFDGKKIFSDGKLEENSVIQNFQITAEDEKNSSTSLNLNHRKT